MLSNIGNFDFTVDFEDIGKKNRTEIKYSENDINSAKISVKCQYKGRDIDLRGCDILIRTQAGENRIEDAPFSVDVRDSVINYIFPTNALINGINHIEIMIVKGDWIKTSPKIYYRVFDGIGESDVVSDVNYPILISLIRDVQTLGVEVQELKDDIIKVNNDISNAENIRIYDENTRKSNETTRISNENNRKSSFTNMQNSVNSSLSNIDGKISIFDDKITLIDNKISEVNTVKTQTETVKNATESVRIATNTVKNETLQVKNDTIAVKDATNTIKTQTETVKNNTESVRVATNTVKTQAENKIVDCETRMTTIENTFGDLVNGTGFASVEYVDGKDAIINSELNTKSNIGHTHTKSDITDFPTISSSVTSTSTSTLSNSNAVKIAHDKGVEALNMANTKSSIGHTHVKSEITNFAHTHSMSDINGLELSSSSVNRPNGKTVEASIVVNETSILSLEKDKSNTGHKHAMSDVTGLNDLKTKVDNGQNFKLTQDSGSGFDISDGDCNNLVGHGKTFYGCRVANAPSDGWWVFENFVTPNHEHGHQIATSWTSDKRMIRWKRGTWQPWGEL